MSADQLGARPQIQVIGVGQQDADAEILGQVARAQPLDGGLRAHRHEHGGFDGAVRAYAARPPARASPGTRQPLRIISIISVTGYITSKLFSHFGGPWPLTGWLPHREVR